MTAFRGAHCSLICLYRHSYWLFIKHLPSWSVFVRRLASCVNIFICLSETTRVVQALGPGKYGHTVKFIQCTYIYVKNYLHDYMKPWYLLTKLLNVLNVLPLVRGLGPEVNMTIFWKYILNLRNSSSMFLQCIYIWEKTNYMKHDFDEHKVLYKNCENHGSCVDQVFKP